MKLNTILRILLLLGLAILIVLARYHYKDSLTLDNLQALVNDLGWKGPLVFIGIYIIATIVFLPGIILTLAGGLLFGPWYGTVYSLVGANVGAVAAFLISRYIAGDWISARLGKRGKRLVDGVDRAGWRFVAILRLMPMLPFNIINYGLGLTRIPLSHCVWASIVFMLPGTIAYAYVGSLGKAVMEQGGKQLLGEIMIALGLLALLAAIPWIVKHTKAAKYEKLAEEEFGDLDEPS